MLLSDGSLLMGVAAIVTSLANLIAVLRQSSARREIDGGGRGGHRDDR